ncbi:triose-phosphate isomerase [Brachybacterium phenoliresistens]|uniref:triose-phosphate isomerase n=1 Tax=Brachybacterium phenoliresistens TaxID=396014 RepID=UPI0031D139CB
MLARPETRESALLGPLLIVNPKAYLYGPQLLDLAVLVDEVAASSKVTTIFTAQHADLRLVAERTRHVVVTAQHMDPLRPGRGMGHVLPESLAAAGARAVVLNHAEHPMSLSDLDVALERSREVGLASIVCADSDAQCHAVATLGPDVMICEPTAAIGTGAMDEGDYVRRTTAIVKAVDPSILVIQAAGVTSGADVVRVLADGADGSGGTSGILRHPDPRSLLLEMCEALRAHPAAAGRSRTPTPTPTALPQEPTC